MAANKTGLFAAAALAGLLPMGDGARAEEAGSEVVVQVVGVKEPAGSVVALLYAKDDGFPGKEAKAWRRVAVPASGATATLRFPAVPPGTYAITVYHDANGNGRLDTNWIGIPKEPVAVSNDAKGHMGPPKWKDARFDVAGAARELTVHLVKP